MYFGAIAFHAKKCLSYEVAQNNLKDLRIMAGEMCEVRDREDIELLYKCNGMQGRGVENKGVQGKSVEGKCAEDKYVERNASKNAWVGSQKS